MIIVMKPKASRKNIDHVLHWGAFAAADGNADKAADYSKCC